MTKTFFVSDLHGTKDKYTRLFKLIEEHKPQLVLLGGDLLPFRYNNFVSDYLYSSFSKLKTTLGKNYPLVLLIFGNDDPKKYVDNLHKGEQKKLWTHINNIKVNINGYEIYGYAYCPPTPFQLKDWEKYDISRFVDPGCVSPEEGIYTTKEDEEEKKFSTIKDDLTKLTGKDDLSKSIFLFHSPPYKTNLDRAALDNKVFEHVPLDVHVGSIAIRKFIESRQPYLTLHGHIHESTSITGSWKDKIGKTECFNAAHKGKELSIIIFDLEDIESAERVLL